MIPLILRLLLLLDSYINRGGEEVPNSVQGDSNWREGSLKVKGNGE